MMKVGESTDRRPRLVVGIGASAGGLDACKAFLAAMPGNSGIAFVIVMHLDPGAESHIAELFQTATDMEVIQVQTEQALLRNRVYVIAPNSVLGIEDLVVRPREPSDPHGQRKPVDALFTSLAETQGERAVAIVLSGTGNNGSTGLRDVARRGGLCLVQSPETAEYDGMPRNAIETGLAHHVVAPEEMPELLVEYAEHPGYPRGPEDSEPQIEAFDGILALLSRTYGVNFRTSYKRGTLQRRTERRMGLRQISDWSAYLNILESDRKEVAALYADLLIGVTAFFRDPDVWQKLEAEIIPELLERRTDEGVPLKIWVPGCATGEEPYSFAIAFLEQRERMGLTTRFQIFATDVAEDAVVFARRGVYPPAIQESVSSRRLSRFFRRRGEDFEISREVRDSVTFAVHNLLADPPFSQLDLVSCRNVLIYLEPHAQHRIMELFHFALKPGGLLLLGASETVGRHGALFETVSDKARIYRAIAAAGAPQHHHLRWPAEQTPFRAGLHAPIATGPRISRAIEQLVLSQYTRACVAVTESFEIKAFFGPTHEYLVQPTGEARMDLLAWARPGLYPRLRSALERAREHGEKVTVTEMRIERDRVTAQVGCTIDPITSLPGDARVFLVSFWDVPPAPLPDRGRAVESDTSAPLVRQLEAELKGTRAELREAVDQLESISDEYRASTEELLSLNEELQSSNEELESSKEELQSLNEELATINRQLEEKNRELRSAYDDLNNLVASTSIPIIFLDRSLRVRRFTPPATELMRLTQSDIGRSLEHIKERFRNGDVARDARKVLDSLVPITVEVQTENGAWYTRDVLPYRTEDDRIDGVCVAFHDVTDSKEAARQIDEARIYAEAIVRTVGTPLVVLDEELRVVSANDAFYQSFHISPREAADVQLFDLEHGAWDAASLRALLQEVLPARKEVRDYEITHEFATLGRRTMRLNARLMRRTDRPNLILLSIEDVTALKLSERLSAERTAQLATETRRKDQFLAMLGHELRSPLSALVHGLDLLGLGARDPARVEEVQQMMMRQAGRIGKMLDQLLDVARVTAGKIRIARRPVDLAEVLWTATEAVSPLIESRTQKLSTSIPAEQVFVAGDRIRLIQVVENLVTNAAKYTEAGGRIELLLEPHKSVAVIRVRDNGIGMDAALLPHVFELFTQDERSLDRAGGGLGLGLPLVKSLVEMHGGRVDASSPGRGQGSEFVVTLPRMRERRSAERRDETSPAARSTKPLRILVVDDEEDSANALAEILELKGHQTRAVYNGAAALDTVRSFAPDVVLLDLGLPELDGYEVASQLRKECGEGLLLVALTGYQRDRNRLDRAGFDQHLIKPPDMEKLSKWLAEVSTASTGQS